MESIFHRDSFALINILLIMNLNSNDDKFSHAKQEKVSRFIKEYYIAGYRKYRIDFIILSTVENISRKTREKEEKRELHIDAYAHARTYAHRFSSVAIVMWYPKTHAEIDIMESCLL